MSSVREFLYNYHESGNSVAIDNIHIKESVLY